MAEKEGSIRSLGEVVLRVRDLRVMREFYGDVLGLPLLKEFDNMAFYAIAPGYGGHTQILALFDQSEEQADPSYHYTGLDATKTTLHHVAFTIALSDYESEKERLRQLGLHVEAVTHGWVHWRSLYFKDPEGNVVELVCYDQSAQ